jgi:predicted outer membrane repeat protein
MITSVSADSSFIYVNASSGNDANDGLSWQTSKLTIKNATSSALNHDSIEIADGIYTGDGNTNITISKSLTITGQSRTGTIIDGSKSSHIFSILNGYNVTISDLTLQNARSVSGGAITSEGNLTLNDCTFINNSATQYGGAVGYDSGYLTINDSNFYNNSATVNGGALASIAPNLPLNMLLNNCYFLNNTATSGGAVFNTGYLSVNSCDFNTNSATSGGAIFGETTLIFSNSSFENNNASNSGGAVGYDSGYLTINDSNFYNNTAVNTGGALSITSADLPVDIEINNCTFYYDTAQYGGSIFNIGNLTVANSTFKFNSASLYGTIYDEGNTTLQNSAFYNNSCSKVGGAVGFDSGTLKAINCYFSGNSASTTGGAVSSANQYLPLDMYLIQCTFINNTAMYGGAIFNTGNTIISDSNFDSNHATQYGGGVSCDGGNLTVNKTIFSNNTSKQTGGAIESSLTGFPSTLTRYLTVKNCKFLNNTSANGGAICNYMTNINATENLFLNNTASYEGGAIYGTNGTIQFNSFLNNSAAIGKGIYVKLNSNLNANYNWWGTNSGASEYSTGITVTNWMVLNLNANPSTIKSGENSTITMDMLHDNGILNDTNHPDLYYHDPLLGCVPDEQINLSSTAGTINSNVTMVDGTGQSILNTDGVTDSNITISAILDSKIYNLIVNMKDSVPPVVISVYPANKTIISNSSSTVRIVFSEPVQLGGSHGNIQLYNNSVPVLFNKVITGNILELIPVNSLTDGVYTVFIPADALMDMEGNNFENTLNTSFTMDKLKPKVIYNNLKNGTLSIFSNKTINLVFNKIIVMETDQIYLKNSHGTVTPLTVAINKNIVSIKSNVNLVDGNYSLILNKGALGDVYGCDMDKYEVNITIDTNAPKILYTLPSNNRSNVSTTNTIIVKFNEPVQLSSNYITLKSSSGKVIKVKSSLKGNILTIDHSKLSKKTSYTLVLHTGSIRDMAGNPVKLYTTKFQTGKT